MKQNSNKQNGPSLTEYMAQCEQQCMGYYMY